MPTAYDENDDDSGTPTGYTSFDTYFNANAAGAKAGAKRVEKGVADEADAAQSGLKQESEANTAAQTQAADTSVTNNTPYGGPTGMDPSAALQAHYSAAIQRRNLTGSTAGVQNALGRHATGLDASLVQRGGEGFDALRQRYAGLDSALGGARADAQKALPGIQAGAAQRVYDAQQADDAARRAARPPMSEEDRARATEIWRRQHPYEGSRSTGEGNEGVQSRQAPVDDREPSDEELQAIQDELLGIR